MTTTQPTRSDSQKLQARIDEASAAEAEAKARKAEADALTVELDNRQKRRTGAASNSGLAREEAAAMSRKSTAEAERDAAKARQEQLSALVPDLSKVVPGTVTFSDASPPVAGSALTLRAIAEAAAEVATKVAAAVADATGPSGSSESIPKRPLLLITTDLDMATRDSCYREVTAGVDELIDSITALPAPVQDGPKTRNVSGLVAAVASTIPAVLSLLSAHRTVSGVASHPDHQTAAAAVAGALDRTTVAVVHDSLRTVPHGLVYRRVTELSTARRELESKSLDQQLAIDGLQELAARHAEDHATLEAESSKAITAGEDTTALNQKLAASKEELTRLTALLGRAEALLARMSTLATATDSFLAALRVVGAGGRSALTTAALHEQLHAPADSQDQLGSIKWVLCVQAEAGEVHQVTDDRPFIFEDRFSTFAVGSLTYLLLDVTAGTIAASGTESRLASAHGQIGDRITFDP